MAGKRTKPRLKKLRILFVLLGLGVLALVSTVFGMMTAVSQDLPAIYDFAQFKAAKNSEVFDASGEPIGTLTSDQNKILLGSGQISPNVKNAVVAIEDSRFYEHEGVDLRGIARALFKDVLSQSAEQGASTITEQFVKEALTAQESRTVFEKFREAALAYRLERHWSKDKILTEYLNTVYFGEGAYGIEAAARTYFGKAHPGCGTPTEPCAAVLEPWEAALLAAIINSPTAYNPKYYPENALARRNVVLQKMEEQGYITQAQYEEGIKQALPSPADIEPPRLDSRAPYFTAWLRQQLVERYGAAKTFFGGLKVKSTLDLRLQNAAEEAVNNYLGGPAADRLGGSARQQERRCQGDGRRSRLPDQALQPRHPGPAAAGLLDQAVRAGHRARRGDLPLYDLRIGAAGVPLRQARPGNLRRPQRRRLLSRLLRHRLRDHLLRQLDLLAARAGGPEGQDDRGPDPLDRGDDPQDGLLGRDLDQPGDGPRRARRRGLAARLDLRLHRRSATTATGSAAPWRPNPATARSPTPR